jgi:hypothetical protein
MKAMMEEQNIRIAIDRHWAASASGDQLPSMKSITTILCASTHSQARSSTVGVTCKRFVAITLVDHWGFAVRRIVGEGNLWVTEYVINYEGKRAYTVSIMEFRDGKVSHETQYFADPFDAPAWRAQWVERGA